MRSALGTAAPASSNTMPLIQDLKLQSELSLFGAFDSATNTSPLGKIYNQRG